MGFGAHIAQEQRHKVVVVTLASFVEVDRTGFAEVDRMGFVVAVVREMVVVVALVEKLGVVERREFVGLTFLVSSKTINDSKTM